MNVEEPTWDKPGAGQWIWNGTHLPGAPTPLQQALQLPTVEAGTAAMFERYGIPLKAMSFRVVNGRVYTGCFRSSVLRRSKRSRPPSCSGR